MSDLVTPGRRLYDISRAGEQQLEWRLMFEKLSEGFLVGEIIRDADGHVVDWVYLDVNAAWSELVGMPADAVIGRSVREVMPGIEDDWIDDVAGVVADRKPRTFTRDVGVLGRRYDGHAFHLEDDRFAMIFVEVTQRYREERRQAALLGLGDRIRDLDDVAAISAAGSRLVGEALGVARVGFGRIDGVLGTIDLDEGWTADGIEAIGGLYRFADFGRLLDEIMRGEPLVIDDVTTDPRTAADPGPLQALSIGALVNMPVRERGRTVAALFVHAAGPRRWTAEEIGFLRNVADRLEAGVARIEAERRQAVLNGELAHRMKNTLAMVQAIAVQTLRRKTEPAALADFEQRLGALATAHDVLLGRGWETTDLGSLSRGVLGVIAAPERIRIAGPQVLLGERAVVSSSLLLHELGTNAVKYGSLSVPAGDVLLDWTIDHGADGEGEPELLLRWTERGGPPATAPTRKGFGSRLINAGLIGTGGVTLRYEETGFSAVMRAPVPELQSA